MKGAVEPAVRAGSSKTGQTDQELVGLFARAALGEQAALARIYDLTRGLVYGLSLRILRDPTAAEEVALDVYLQAYRQAAAFQADRGTPLSWLVSITRSRAIDRLRAETARGRHRLVQEAEGQADEVAPDPGQALQQAQSRSAVRGALASLSPGERQVLESAYYRGLSCSEIAHELGIPIGTVKSRLRIAMVRLRQHLLPYMEESGS